VGCTCGCVFLKGKAKAVGGWWDGGLLLRSKLNQVDGLLRVTERKEESFCIFSIFSLFSLRMLGWSI